MIVKKIINVGLVAVAALSLIFWLLVTTSDAVDTPYAGVLFVISYILAAVVVVSILVFLIDYQFKHPYMLKRNSIALAVFLAFIVICYAVSGDPGPTEAVSRGMYKVIETGLYLLYIMVVLCILLMLFFAVRRIFSKN